MNFKTEQPPPPTSSLIDLNKNANIQFLFCLIKGRKIQVTQNVFKNFLLKSHTHKTSLLSMLILSLSLIYHPALAFFLGGSSAGQTLMGKLKWQASKQAKQSKENEKCVLALPTMLQDTEDIIAALS